MVRKIGIFKDPRKKLPWAARWFGLPDMETGKPKRYSRSFRTKREADDFVDELKGELKAGRPRDTHEEKTLSELCDWVIKANRKDWEIATIREYQRATPSS